MLSYLLFVCLQAINKAKFSFNRLFLGAIFRDEDAHLLGALKYSVNMLNTTSFLTSVAVEILRSPYDHYELVQKGAINYKMTYQRTNYEILIHIVCNLLEKNDGIVALIGPSELKLSLQMANLASSV